MIYNLKEYQRDAVDELKELIELYLTKTNKTIVFKSPTGSGKTFMLSSLLEEVAEENPNANFCVLWACPGKGELQKQSFDNVKTYLGGDPVCSLLEDEFFGSRKYINKHEIVFVNWEKLVSKDKETGKWINNLMKDQEGQNFIDIIDQTKKNGTKIILVVDESHIGASHATRISDFKKDIVIPDITIEMSATPLSEHIDIEVDIQRVIDEGIIKKDVIVNEGIYKDDVKNADKDSELLVLEKGYEKRLELKKAYEEISSIVNPLVLIQIPNVVEGEAKKIVIQDFLREHDITEENGKLKLWCDDKGNFDKKKIKRIDDVTEYLIFKTAVATGWDCPRASILVKFREGKSETFEIQTIGRILRTAEAKSYGNELLDNAYIFTNISEFETRRDTYCPNRIKTEFSSFRKGETRLSVWEATHLKSFYRSRQGDYNSADSRFQECYEKEFMRVFGFNDNDKYAMGDANVYKFEDKGVSVDIKTSDSLIEETTINAGDIDKEKRISGEGVKVRMADTDVQAHFYNIIRENLSGLAYARSKSPVHSAIINIFSKFYNMFSRDQKVSCIERIVVNNSAIFSEILSAVTTKFREMLMQEKGKTGKIYDFKILDKRGYSTETHKVLTGSLKSLYQPLYVLMDASGNVNHLEKEFLNFLDSQNCVRWYWENGTELMEINFGIPYNDGMNTFQPDFIVKFNDGTVGIFDTKGVGERVDDTKVKAEALHKYLESINTNRGYLPKVIGGIVIKSNSQFYVYDEVEYVDYQADSSKWVNFNELIRGIEANIFNEKYLEDFKK